MSGGDSWHRVLTVSEGMRPSNPVSFSFQGAEAVSMVLTQTCHLFPQSAPGAFPVLLQPACYFRHGPITFQLSMMTQDP